MELKRRAFLAHMSRAAALSAAPALYTVRHVRRARVIVALRGRAYPGRVNRLTVTWHGKWAG
ncbi:MAG: hypothetical protein GY851_36285 [bacterium]|nr:hypothetical protein [bacterium]